MQNFQLITLQKRCTTSDFNNLQTKSFVLYKVAMDDLIYAFMQIANNKSWLKDGSTGFILDFVSL